MWQRFTFVAKNKKPPIIRDATLGRARVIKQERRHIIALVTKTRASNLTERAILKEALRSLYYVTLQLNLQTISISETDVNSMPWAYIKKILQELYNSPTRIILCNNRVTIPELSDRNKIILENHASAIGGHKGITKTYKRIRHNYFWSGMKTEIQTFVQECRNCQLKKLVCVKTR